MKLFYDNNGVVTVFVTIILIPTLLFTGFMVDLARIKCYQSQAIMAADSYANSVISNYNGLLKEMYGLFSVTGDEEVLEALDVLASLSFDPNNTEYVADSRFYNLDLVAGINDNQVSGFTPYSTGSVKFDYSVLAGLDDAYVLENQITEYMKYRGPIMFASSIFEEDGKINSSNLLNITESLENTEVDSETIELKNNVDEAVSECIRLISEYAELESDNEELNSVLGTEYGKEDDSYYGLLTQCMNYIDDLYTDISICNDIISTYELIEGLTAEESKCLEEARLIIKLINEGGSDKVPIIEWEGEKTSGRQYYYAAKNIYEKEFKNKFTEKKDYIKTLENDIVTEDKLVSLAQKITEQIDKIKQSIEKLEIHKDSLEYGSESYKLAQNVLDEIYINCEEIINFSFETESESIKASVDKMCVYLLDQKNILDDTLSIQNAFEQLAGYASNSGAMTGYTVITKNSLKSYINLYAITDYYLLKIENKEMYDILVKSQEIGEENKSKKEKEAENQQEKSEQELDELIGKDEDSVQIPDDIWETYNQKNGILPKNSFLAMIKDAANSLSSLSLENCVNDFVNYAFVVQYDLSMFSCATTDINYDATTGKGEKISGEERTKSITDYIMEDNAFLYQGELEYLYAAQRSVSDCQSAFQWKLAGIRGAMNYAATYRIVEINSAIQTLAAAANLIFPGLGLGVSSALRIAVASAETVCEMKVFLAGGKVDFFKSQLSQLECYNTVKSMLGMEQAAGTGLSNKALAYSYKDYLSVFIICFVPKETLINRTGQLIELNVTYAQSGSKDFSKLSFKLEDTITLIEANCKVDIEPIFVTMDFERLSERADEVEDFFTRGYQYSVIRGY